MAKIEGKHYLSYDIDNALRQYSDKLNISRSIIISYAIKEYFKNHSEELKKLFKDKSNLISEIIVARSIEKNKNIIKAVSLFDNTMDRLFQLKIKGITYKETVEFVKNEIDVMKNMNVSYHSKKPRIKLFKDVLIKLKKHKEHYKAFVEELYGALKTFKPQIVAIKENTGFRK